MQSKRTIENLNKSARDHSCVRVTMKRPRGERYDGIVLSHHGGVIVLHLDDGLELGGIVVLPKKLIGSVGYNKHYRCWTEVLRHSGEMSKLSRLRWIKKITSMKQAIEAIHKRGIWPGVETVTRGRSSYYIGPIVSTCQRYFDLRCYDAAGKWEGVYELRYSKISMIQIFDSYTTHFNHYMQERRDQEE